ncbi:Nitrogen permease regulator 2, partial [Parelaphostrongylus tenuis]
LAADGLSRSVWEDTKTPGDGRNHDALLAFKTVMIVSSYPAQYDENAKNFSEQVLARMKDPPFYCTTACQGTQKSCTAALQSSRFAGQLHDAFYAYAKALNITLSLNDSDISNGITLLKNIEMTFEGKGDMAGPI